MKPVRGTPPFWQATQKDLFAMLRQLGIPTWFCSFSCADMRWKEILTTMLRQEGKTATVEDLDWSGRNSLLKRNPVIAARMFDHGFQKFLKEVIMSDAAPIGQIKDFFYRIEFQHRGAPHAHCLFWVENAPRVDKNTDSDCIAFVDKYITCKIPSNDELEEIVNSVQRHSKRHSKTCRKKGTTCRFNFPRLPSQRTFISRCAKDKKHNLNDFASLASMKVTDNQAQDVFNRLKEVLTTDIVSLSTEQLFERIGISQGLMEKAHAKFAGKTSVVLERAPNAIWVNQYNEHLLHAWDANMDIQFVVDAYSCVVYIISYISKAEREMGLLLDQTQKEARNQGNQDAKQAMKALGNVYLHNRELSAQEAVYRITSMPLKRCSRKVVFIPTGEFPIRMSLPLHVLQQQAKQGDTNEKNLWMISSTDRYRNRPNQLQNVCLASFCSEYSVVPIRS